MRHGSRALLAIRVGQPCVLLSFVCDLGVGSNRRASSSLLATAPAAPSRLVLEPSSPGWNGSRNSAGRDWVLLRLLPAC